MNHPAALLLHDDCLQALRRLDDESVDVVITDPPYGLADLSAKKVTEAITRWASVDRAWVPVGRGFMGQTWDRFVPPPAVWGEVLRVLKPGGWLASFASPRTLDLMGLSIRLAGFQVKDTISWIRSDSFPKSKQSLKPAHEPILLAVKPGASPVLDIEGNRIPYRNDADRDETVAKNRHGDFGTVNGGNRVYGDFGTDKRENYAGIGRWPTNVALSEEAADQLDARHPVSRSRKGKPRQAQAGEGWGLARTGTEHDDFGGPSRFFPRFEDEPRAFYAGRAVAAERPVSDDGVRHPTVKPLSVMRWLVRLLTPTGGVVLDPFAGSGTTVEAAIVEGRQWIAVEANSEYIPLIQQRIERATAA